MTFYVKSEGLKVKNSLPEQTNLIIRFPLLIIHSTGHLS